MIKIYQYTAFVMFNPTTLQNVFQKLEKYTDIKNIVFLINRLNPTGKEQSILLSKKKSYLNEIAFFKNKIIYSNKLLRLQHLNLFYLLVIRIQPYHFL